MYEPACRACHERTGHLVLDLGEQPACDYFPPCDDPGPDPVYPLQMWLCSSCGLAQLVADPTVPEEPKGAEPAALASQAAGAVERVAVAGLLPDGGRVAEYGSPHGGSWLGLLAQRGLRTVHGGEPADVILDCFGLMHCADQSAALAERVARVNPGGVLLLQYHSLGTIIRRGQWNALRHGHYAYYSTTALATMLAANDFSPRMAWQFELYGGTVLLAASRDVDKGAGPTGPLRPLLAEDARVGVRDPTVLGALGRRAQAHAKGLHDWLVTERSVGRTVLGYGAASRAVALLRQAGVDRALLPAVVDASPAKQGLRMPGTDIPVVNPARLAAYQPDAVLLFLTDLLNEVRVAFPEVEAAGGRWVDAEALVSGPSATGQTG
jgi:C-methyltransferase C-terminal domain/Putative zinc binding domain